MVLVVLGQGADSKGAQELVFIQETFQNLTEHGLVDEGEEEGSTLFGVFLFEDPGRAVFLTVGEEPVETLFKPGEEVDVFGVQRQYREQWDQPNYCTKNKKGFMLL